MQRKFNVGDKVKIATTSEYYERNHDSNPKTDGCVVKVSTANILLPISVTWPNGSNAYHATDLTLVKEKQMKTNTTMFKIVTDTLFDNSGSGGNGMKVVACREEAARIVDALISHGIIDEDKPWYTDASVEAWTLFGNGSRCKERSQGIRSRYAAQGNLFRTESEAIAERDRRTKATNAFLDAC